MDLKKIAAISALRVAASSSSPVVGGRGRGKAGGMSSQEEDDDDDEDVDADLDTTGLDTSSLGQLINESSTFNTTTEGSFDFCLVIKEAVP